MSSEVTKRRTDHPILWTFGGLGNVLAAIDNLHGVWWLWMILAGICWTSLIGWWERRG